jgi:potassium efflux system protein
MRSPSFPFIVVAPATLTLWLLVVSCGFGQQSLPPDSSIYVPGRNSGFRGVPAQAVYKDVVRMADLPPLHIHDPAARPLPRSSQPAAVSSPVALVSYQEEAEPAEQPAVNDSPLPGGLSWMNEPVFMFGGLFPVNDQTIDRFRLSRLKQSLDELAARVEAASETPPGTQETLDRAMERHRVGLANLERIDWLRKDIQEQPRKLQRLQEAMSQPLPEPPREPDDSIGLEACEALLQEQRTHEERLRNEYNTAEALIRERNQQIENLARQDQQIEEQLQTATAQIEGHSGTGLLAQANLLENQMIVLLAKINQRLLTIESQWLSAAEKSTYLQRDWLKRQLDHAQARLQQLAKQVARRQDEVIKAEAEKARREAMGAHPLLRDLAEENAVLAEQRTLVSRTNRVNLAAQQELDEQLQELADSRRTLDEHLAAAGHSQAVGLLLRFERTKLPQTSQSRKKILEIEQILPDLKLKRLEINDQLKSLPGQQAKIEQSVEELDPSTTHVPAAELSAKASELLGTKREYLYDLNSEYETYLNGLASLQHSHEQLLESTSQLRNYIDRHVLWIRSAEPIDSADFRKSLQALRTIGTSDQWQSLVHFLTSRLNGRWLLIVVLAAGLWLGIGMRKQLDRRLRHVCRRRSEVRVAPLVRSLALTIFQAALLPALVATLGWLLWSPYEAGTLKNAISRGLLMITPQLFIASFVFRIAIRGGVAETQLGWVGDVCDRVRVTSGTIARYCLPLLALTKALESWEDGYWIDSLGRLVFIVSMLILSLASFRLLHGIGRAWRHDPESGRSIWKLTFGLWAPPVVLAPLALVCVSALGFMYSSVFLGVRLLMTWWLILGVATGYYLARRLIDIGHNIIVARRRWRAVPETAFAEISDASNTVDKEMNAIRLQVIRLLHVGSVAVCLVVAFAFWQDVLPAIKALDYGLWQVNRQTETLGPDQKTMIAVSKLAWITVGDILRFLLVLGATIVISRNLPGLLQMVILDRLPLDRGGKYAISIVCRYVAGAIGLILACRMIGFSWNSVQWLVAAMSVGLGFGLQEIFANFVAGIIILLERPIRVGDFVTVNGTTGFVSRIQLRATMILDYDRRELIVPNKKFITDDVINWTLSDSITRVVIPVGIAYGSDTRLAHSVLLRVARDNSQVLRDPRPEVIFSGFGGSALDFELRVHIANREGYHEVLHQLHMAIDLEFRKQNIVIAFPQQDVHVKGLEPLIRLAELPPGKKAG